MSLALIDLRNAGMKKLDGKIITTRYIEDDEAKEKLRILATHWGVSLPEAMTYSVLAAFDCLADEIADGIRKSASKHNPTNE